MHALVGAMWVDYTLWDFRKCCINLICNAAVANQYQHQNARVSPWLFDKLPGCCIWVLAGSTVSCYAASYTTCCS